MYLCFLLQIRSEKLKIKFIQKLPSFISLLVPPLLYITRLNKVIKHNLKNKTKRMKSNPGFLQ